LSVFDAAWIELQRLLEKLLTWWKFRSAVQNAHGVDFAAHSRQRDVVVLPCWRRPEFLWHCLDNLAKAEGIGDITVIVRPDTGFAPENLEVVHGFAERLPHLELQYPTPAPYRRTKQSANILLGYLLAAARTKEFVFLIEEDVMVGRDFFRWHREVHSTSSTPLFCSIAVNNPNRRLMLPPDIEDYYLSTGDYCSTGMCFDKRILQSKLAQHVNMRYMRRPKKYIRRHFRSSHIGLGFVEQDGLIRRIQEESQLPIAWPCVPRAFHAGFYGYNRQGGLTGALPERIRILAETIYDVAAIQKLAGQTGFPDNCIPCELQTPPWRRLQRVEVPAAG
jgi:hypothetical protein